MIVKAYEHNLESEQCYTWISSEKDIKMMIRKIGEILHLILSGDLVKGLQRISLETLVKKELTLASGHSSKINNDVQTKTTSLWLNDKVY